VKSLNRLAAFYHAVKHGGTRAAARALDVEHNTISVSLSRLQRHTLKNVTLLLRKKHGPEGRMQPTPEGQFLFEQLLPLMLEADRIEALLANFEEEYARSKTKFPVTDRRPTKMETIGIALEDLRIGQAVCLEIDASTGALKIRAAQLDTSTLPKGLQL
jgi:DNA-binding MarR family transcriptional regulator